MLPAVMTPAPPLPVSTTETEVLEPAVMVAFPA
jgi:hypothetical protein